jgi:hypothetical protein
VYLLLQAIDHCFKTLVTEFFAMHFFAEIFNKNLILAGEGKGGLTLLTDGDPRGPNARVREEVR